MMSDNTSFVLQSVGQVTYDQRPIPESVALLYSIVVRGHSQTYSHTVRDDEVLVQVKKTGKSPSLFWFLQVP
jgi:hypothetical protein